VENVEGFLGILMILLGSFISGILIILKLFLSEV
jgi:hypothetical protein